MSGSATPCPATRVTLGEILTQRSEIIPPRDNPSGSDIFVGLEHIESGTGRRLGSEPIDKSAMTGRKARFRPGDLVYGYLRPYLNKVWLADFEGLCSVDQYVYIVDARRADAEFVAWFMRSPQFLSRAPVDSGPGQLPRIRLHEVARVELDLPPWSEQKRVAAELRNQMCAAARMRAAVESSVDRARELEMTEATRLFLSEDASAWPVDALGEILKTCSGLTPSRARSDFFGGESPWVKTGELLDGTVTDTIEHVTGKALAETSLRLLPVDTLLVAMYGQGQTRGRTSLLGVPATTNQACFAVLPSEDIMNQQFLQYWFRVSYGRIREESEGRGGNRPNLNGVLLRQQKIPHPAMAIQRAVARRLSHVSETSQVVVDATVAARNSAEQLSSSLLRRAFSEGG